MAFSFFPLASLPLCEDHLSLKHTFKNYTYPLNQRIELVLSLALHSYDAKLDSWKPDRAMALTSEELVILRVSSPGASKDQKVGLIPKKRVMLSKIEGLGVSSRDPEVLVIFGARKKPIILKSQK
jgi:hypothetical protein